jgi:hypothetical protein
MSLTEIDPNVIASHGPFQLTATGVVATGRPTYDEWEAAITWAQRVERTSSFWLADLLLFGEHAYGEMYTNAIEATGLRYGTLANYVSVARHIDRSRRRELLSFEHHKEIVRLTTPSEQEYWLDRAETEGLTVQQLRLRIQDAKAKAAGHRLEYLITVICTSAEQQQELAARLRAEAGVVEVHVGGKP